MPDEHTIADNLQRLQDAKTAIGNAITAKGGTVAAGDGLEEFATAIGTIPTGSEPVLIAKTITDNGTYDPSDDDADGYSSVTANVPNTYAAGDEGKVVFSGALVAQTALSPDITENGTVDTTFYNSVTVNVKSGGGGSPSNAVNFYDYDGTIVQSYSADEFANLSELPTNPTHTGLTAQGWNWLLTDAKAYVASYGKLNIGQMYITSDGKTKLYISLSDGRSSPILQLSLNSNSELDIDWGDGSAHSTFTATSAGYKSERHEYSAAGDYVIAITVVSGGFVFRSSSASVSTVFYNGNNSSSSPDVAYNNAIKKIEIGNGVTGIGGSAFNHCYMLSSITIPNGVTGIGSYAFQNCYALSSITIPNSATGIGDNAFQTCHVLSSIAIPNGATGIDNYAFSGCYVLSSITVPDDVTSIGQQAFQYCYVLSSITIPDGVTSIGSSAFNYCALSSVTIPASVTSIGSKAFADCSYMSFIKFESTTPPTVANSNAWQNVSASTKILVPTGTLETYKSATNYPNPSTYTYEEY